MILLAGTDALIIDLRHCLGGEPAMTAFIISYLWDHEPAQLSGLRERSQLKQAWTLPYVPGGRFGKAKPVYVLTSAATFSGGEQLSYDLQHLGRAIVIGERTRGGAHAREGFTVHPTWRRLSPSPKQSTRKPAATGKAQASPPTSRPPPPRPATPPTGGPSRM
jgi:C-terminal processing protease CtpA/Prc